MKALKIIGIVAILGVVIVLSYQWPRPGIFKEIEHIIFRISPLC